MSWSVDRAWDVQPGSDSLFQIGMLKAGMLLAGNTFRDLGTVQLFGMCLGAVIADNVFVRRWAHYFGTREFLGQENRHTHTFNTQPDML